MALVAFYPSQDLVANRAFFEGLLGLPLVRDQGVCLIYKVADKAYVGFCSHLEAVNTPNSIIITLVHEDVDGEYQRYQARGIPNDGPPRLNERYGIYHFFAHSPEGYRVEVQRFNEALA